MKKNIEIVPNIEKLFGTRDENLQILEEGLSINIDLKSDYVLRDHAQHAAQVTLGEVMAGATEMIEVGKDLLRPRDVAGRALDQDGVGFKVNVDAQTLFQYLQILVAGAEKLLDVGDDFDVFLHSALYHCLQCRELVRGNLRTNARIEDGREQDCSVGWRGRVAGPPEPADNTIKSEITPVKSPTQHT